jgi:hypothetical protein
MTNVNLRESFGHNFEKAPRPFYKESYQCTKCKCVVHHLETDINMWGSIFDSTNYLWLGSVPDFTCDELLVRFVMKS